MQVGDPQGTDAMDVLSQAQAGPIPQVPLSTSGAQQVIVIGILGCHPVVILDLLWPACLQSTDPSLDRFGFSSLPTAVSVFCTH